MINLTTRKLIERETVETNLISDVKKFYQQYNLLTGADMVGFVPIVLGPMIQIINQQIIPKTLIENTGDNIHFKQVKGAWCAVAK